jgi:membrane associated rhomboid family serine protease
MISITLVIVILTAIISFSAFKNEKVTNDLIFYPLAVSRRNEWYRFLSCALIHADVMHLAFNMLALYMFGRNLELMFSFIFPGKAGLMFILIYVLAQFICLIPTYLAHKDSAYYRSLGASGAVSGIVFAAIFLSPLDKVGLLILPIMISGFIFAFIYLGLTMYLARRGGDNINHSAHFWGSAAGVILTIIFCYAFSTFDPVNNFLSQVKSYLNF